MGCGSSTATINSHEPASNGVHKPGGRRSSASSEDAEPPQSVGAADPPEPVVVAPEGAPEPPPPVIVAGADEPEPEPGRIATPSQEGGESQEVNTTRDVVIGVDEPAQEPQVDPEPAPADPETQADPEQAPADPEQEPAAEEAPADPEVAPTEPEPPVEPAETAEEPPATDPAAPEDTPAAEEEPPAGGDAPPAQTEDTPAGEPAPAEEPAAQDPPADPEAPAEAPADSEAPADPEEAPSDPPADPPADPPVDPPADPPAADDPPAQQEQEPAAGEEDDPYDFSTVGAAPAPEKNEGDEYVPPAEGAPAAWTDPGPRPPPGYSGAEDEAMDPAADPVVRENMRPETVTMGRHVHTLDTRASGSDGPGAVERPAVEGGALWTDPDFPYEVAMDGLDPGIAWSRPKEFCESPCLFVEDTTRFDIGQGAAGTCYFLSVLSSIADKPDVIKQIIPDGAYGIGSDAYDGVFHARFWRFGTWVDVYVDDLLPTVDERPWGARSATDSNEMWVSLMEKAFAKLLGGYKAAFGGWAGDAFIALTGGLAERVETVNVSPRQLFSRLRNAVGAGAVIAASVPADKDGTLGLVGGHAYTLTGTAQAGSEGGTVALVRVRNPWGSQEGEWTGAWADNSPQWDSVNDNTKERLKVSGKGDGEFWMSLEDYCAHFSDTHICNFTPDVDKDGTPDGLDQVTSIFGAWSGQTAAGSDPGSKFNNQKFIITVPSQGVDENGLLPVVLQFMREKKGKDDTNNVYIRLDAFKIDFTEQTDRVYYVLDERTNNTTFFGGADLCYRYLLEPGDYLILPTTMEAGVEADYCTRVFSTQEIAAREVTEPCGVFMRRSEFTFEHDGVTHNCCRQQNLFGRWQADENAGGQISHRSFPSNPQILLSLPDGGPHPVCVSLKQVNEEPQLAIGFKIYPISDASLAPLNLRHLWSEAGSAVRAVSGEAGIFIAGYEGDLRFLLDGGAHYVLIAFTDKPDDEKKFALTLASEVDINVTPFNMV